MITKLPKNIDSLLVKLESEMIQDKTNDMKQKKQLFSSCRSQAQFLRSERIEKIDEQAQADGTKDRLEAKKQELSLYSVIKDVESWIKKVFSSMQRSVQTKTREEDRYGEALAKIDENKTDIVQENPRAQSVATTQNGTVAVNQALSAQMRQTCETQRQQETRQSVEQGQVAGAAENQKSMVQKQLDILKKSKFFGVFFQILSFVVQFIPTVGTFLKVAVSAAQQLVTMWLNNSMADRQMEEQNSAREVQLIIKNILRNDQHEQKTRVTEQKVLNTLEQANA